MSSSHAAPVEKKFFTTGMKIVTALMVVGLGTGMVRMFMGIGSITNLDDQYPWGLWIGVDVATGVALAAGGFTTGALVYIFHRELFHDIIRPALLTALLGYTFVAIGLAFDLGRWYNIWHPTIPSMWQGNSVLFEVGICVTIYLNVLYIEFAPIVLERFIGKVKLPGGLSKFNELINSLLRTVNYILGKVMFLFIIAGVVLSCLHQSSLGTLMVITPYKMHPLYWSQLSPLLFLSSAIAVGFPMVIFESIISGKSFGRKPETHILGPLSRMVPWLIGVYVALKIGDMIYRQSYVYLFDGSLTALMFWIEFGVLTLIPFFLFMSKDIRNSSRALFIASTMYILGILVNRSTVFFIAFKPYYAEKAYIPAMGELALTIGLVCSIIFIYRLAVTFLPVLPKEHAEVAAN